MTYTSKEGSLGFYYFHTESENVVGFLLACSAIIEEITDEECKKLAAIVSGEDEYEDKKISSETEQHDQVIKLFDEISERFHEKSEGADDE